MKEYKDLSDIYSDYPNLENLDINQVTQLMLACSMMEDDDFAHACREIIKRHKEAQG